jgi:hypothetical protein
LYLFAFASCQQLYRNFKRFGMRRAKLQCRISGLSDVELDFPAGRTLDPKVFDALIRDLLV